MAAVRRRHFGSVRKLPSGRWQVRYKGPDGQPRTGEGTFTTKGEAQRHLAEIEHQVNSGRWTDPKARALTLAAYSEDWLAYRQLAVRTRELYADLLRLHILPQLGGLPVGRVTPREVRRWHKGRSDATGPTRVGQAYRLLRTILGTAVRDGLLPSNPCHITGAGSVKSPERPYMSPEDAGALIAATSPGMRVLVVVTLLAHLRLGELLALRREDVDLAAGTLQVRRAQSRTKAGPVVKATKTGHARTVHLPPDALAALRDHLAAVPPGLPSAPLFAHPSGQPLERHHVNVAWKRAREAAGLPQFHFHDLRHAGLTWFAQGGASTREIMVRGGHRSYQASLIYQHAAEQRVRELASRLSLAGPAAALGQAPDS